LYGLPLEEFTAERNALAGELRREGDGQSAAAVKALRKPTAAAWALNQLVRAETDLVEALLGAGGELRQAHRQAASGKGAQQMRIAAEAERRAVDQLLQRAPEVLGRPVGAALAESIRNTLHAASSNDKARELVRSGTLTTELRPVGLGPMPAATRAGKARAAGPSPTARTELRAAKASEAALSREVEAATRALAQADEAYARARELAETASVRASDARKRLRAARDGLAEAKRTRERLER
jgi:hypothetical protein